MLAIPVLSPSRSPGKPGAEGQAIREQTFGQALSEAFAHRSYLLLTAGFFVCGFHVAFITAHLPAFIVDRGLDPRIGAWSLALIGLFNVVGSLAAGYIGQHYSKPIFLSLIYLARAVAIALFVLLPVTPLSRARLRLRRSGCCGSPPCRRRRASSPSCSARNTWGR